MSTDTRAPIREDEPTIDDLQWEQTLDRTPFGNLKSLVASTKYTPGVGVQPAAWYRKQASAHIMGLGETGATDRALARIFDELDVDEPTYSAAEAM
jgi:hypothetical protein